MQICTACGTDRCVCYDETELDRTPNTRTPGPVALQDNGHCLISAHPEVSLGLARAGAMIRGCVCQVGLSPRETNYGARQSYPEACAEQAANAHLIAAAPAMLAALEQILALQDQHDCFEDCVRNAEEIARAAIREAKGEA